MSQYDSNRIRRRDPLGIASLKLALLCVNKSACNTCDQEGRHHELVRKVMLRSGLPTGCHALPIFLRSFC